MAYLLERKLVVGVASSALFDLTESHNESPHVFRRLG